MQGAGKKPITLGIEEELIKFIIEYRHQQIALNSHEIILKLKVSRILLMENLKVV